MGTAGKNARIKVMSPGLPQPFFDQETTSNEARTVYQVTNQTYLYWDPKAPLVVKKSTDGGLTYDLVTDGYKVWHAAGSVLFDEPLGLDDLVQVTGEYFSVATAAMVRSYTFGINNQIEDSSAFGDGWRRKMSTLIDGSGTLTGFYDVDNLLQDRILAGVPLVLELNNDREDIDGEFLSFYALLSGHEVGAPVEGLAHTSVPWETDGEIVTIDKNYAFAVRDAFDDLEDEQYELGMEDDDGRIYYDFLFDTIIYWKE